jgi:hypothetical protein
MNLSVLAPSFNCAAKFLKLPGSICGEGRPADGAWQEGLERFPVESCAWLCKRGKEVKDLKEEEMRRCKGGRLSMR